MRLDYPGARRLFVVALAVIAISVAAGFFATRGDVRPHLPAAAPVGTGVTSGLKASTAAPAATLAVPLPTLDPAMVTLGAAVYASRCASCHGARGEGQPNWWVARPDGSYPAAPHDATGHTWHHADAELERIVREGGTFYLPQSTMPAFGQSLQAREIRAVITYIKTFWGPRERGVQADVTREEQAAEPPAIQDAHPMARPGGSSHSPGSSATGRAGTPASDHAALPTAAARP